MCYSQDIIYLERAKRGGRKGKLTATPGVIFNPLLAPGERWTWEMCPLLYLQTSEASPAPAQNRQFMPNVKTSGAGFPGPPCQLQLQKEGDRARRPSCAKIHISSEHTIEASLVKTPNFPGWTSTGLGTFEVRFPGWLRATWLVAS